MPVLPRTSPAFAEMDELRELIGEERDRRLRDAAAAIADRLEGGTLWHLNSTGAGGGVAEMLHTLLPLYRSLGVPARWAVIGGDTPFFTVTKRLGAALYGDAGDGGALGPAEQDAYRRALSAEADALREMLGPRDVLFLHDHQTAGLLDHLHKETAAAYWRCHVGVDEPNDVSEAAWDFLTPFLAEARGLVFSLDRHVPQRLRGRHVEIIPPFVSPFSAKNRPLEPSELREHLAWCGLGSGRDVRPSGDVRLVAEAAPAPDEPLVTQVSRWDRLKDMHGVLAAFAEHVDHGYLALVGPDPAGIADDNEQGLWFGRCLDAWRALPPGRRRRVGLVCLPMTDVRHNALLVNAVQRASDVVVQKSLAEGFGLTVTEAMWKSRIVVGSAVGGIREQISHGVDGLLVDDPADLTGFGALLASVTRGAAATSDMGDRARRRVLRDYLPDREVIATARLLTAG